MQGSTPASMLLSGMELLYLYSK